MRFAKNVLLVVSSIAIFTIASFYLAFYQLSFTYLEENKAKEIGYYFFGGVALTVVIFITVKNIKTSVSTGQFNLGKFFSRLAIVSVLLLILSLLLGSVIANWALAINANIGTQKTTIVEGSVIFWKPAGRRTKAEIHVKDPRATTVYKFDTYETEYRPPGTSFKEKLYVGCLGLMYRK